MLNHKRNLNTFLKTEIIQSIFSHHNGIKLEITTEGELKKIHKYMKIKQHTETINESKKK